MGARAQSGYRTRMRVTAVPIPAGMPGQPWPPLVATRGPGAESALHAHHAMHLILAGAGTLRVRSGGDRAWRCCAGVLTAPDAPHAVDARGVEVLLVFIDPESEAGRTLRAAAPGALLELSPMQRDRLAGTGPAEIMGPGGPVFCGRILETLGAPTAPSSPVHPRVRRLLRLLATMPVRGAVPVEELARAAGLSPGRLMHAFEASIGIPIRPYLLWLKLQRAGAAIAGGASLSVAAHAAGFADSAHMARTFRRMMGAAPSEIRRATQDARGDASRAGARQARAKAPERT
jgi:AraC-like DNA-binding protein